MVTLTSSSSSDTGSSRTVSAHQANGNMDEMPYDAEFAPPTLDAPHDRSGRPTSPTPNSPTRH
jgi:hypothetical protein